MILGISHTLLVYNSKFSKSKITCQCDSLLFPQIIASMPESTNSLLFSWSVKIVVFSQDTSSQLQLRASIMYYSIIRSFSTSMETIMPKTTNLCSIHLSKLLILARALHFGQELNPLLFKCHIVYYVQNKPFNF